jgi:hypothetical protein
MAAQGRSRSKSPSCKVGDEHGTAQLLVFVLQSVCTLTMQISILTMNSLCYWAVSSPAGVVSFRVELESKKLTVVGNVSPTEVLECVCKVTKHAEILQAP